MATADIGYDDPRMTLVEHLDELRKRLFYASLAIAISTVVVFTQWDRILEFLTAFYRDAANDPEKNLVNPDLLGSIAVRLKVAGYGGLYLSSPVWLFQLWKFITPGLRKKEKQYAIPFVVSSVLLFTAGGAVALLTLPQALKFLISFAGRDVEPLLSPQGFVGLVVLMVVSFGVCFEFPVVLVALQLAGITSSTALLKGWRYAIVIVVLIAAVATPSQDPFSLFAMAIPMWLLYFVAIGIGKLAKK
jgi:sec-independent protein translocase protein TatC